MIYKEQLMIGDWVLYKGHPVRISQLNRDTFNTTTFFGENDGVGYSYEDIEGIRLTRDILEQIGFHGDGYGYYKIDDWHYFMYYYFENRLQRFAKKPGTEGLGDLIFQCHTTYLHEFQHALTMTYVSIDFGNRNFRIKLNSES